MAGQGWVVREADHSCLCSPPPQTHTNTKQNTVLVVNWEVIELQRLSQGTLQPEVQVEPGKCSWNQENSDGAGTPSDIVVPLEFMGEGAFTSDSLGSLLDAETRQQEKKQVELQFAQLYNLHNLHNLHIWAQFELTLQEPHLCYDCADDCIKIILVKCFTDK